MKTLFALIILVFVVAPPLYGQNSYRDFERGLKLTEPQRMRMEQINRRYMSEVRNLQQESVNRRLQMRDLDKNSPQNRERMLRLRREIQDIEMSRGNSYNQYRNEVGRTLNDQQRERYNRFCDKDRGYSHRLKPRGYER